MPRSDKKDDVDGLLRDLDKRNLVTPARGSRGPLDPTSNMRSAKAASAAYDLIDVYSPGTLAAFENDATGLDVTLGGHNDPAIAASNRRKEDPTMLMQEFSKKGITDMDTVVRSNAVEAALVGDPRVVFAEDVVVLRSSGGPCLSICSKPVPVRTNGSSNSNSSKPKLGWVAAGNPSSRSSQFTMVTVSKSNAVSESGIVKFGDKVMLKNCKGQGWFLAALRPGEPGYEAALKTTGLGSPSVADNDFLEYQRAQQQQHSYILCMTTTSNSSASAWVLVEADEGGLERRRERQARSGESVARVHQQATSNSMGLSTSSDLAPQNNKVQTAIRSSDAVFLKKAGSDSTLGSLYLRAGLDGNISLVHVDTFGGDQLGQSDMVWNIVKSPAPFQASWSREHRLLNGNYGCSDVGDFCLDNGVIGARKQKGAVLEGLVVDDLLFALQGVPGELVVCAEDENSEGQWLVSESRVGDPSLRALAERFLPLCEHFCASERFVLRRSRPEYGRVSHALGAAMGKLMREYQVLLAQLEHAKQMGSLGLQKLWFYMQPAMRTLEILAIVSTKVVNHTGGALLNAVHALSCTGGDVKSRTIFKYLMENAAVPYLEMLELWIYQGVIRDPYNEFMVCVDGEASSTTVGQDFNARYWAHRYTLRDGDAQKINAMPNASIANTNTNAQPAVSFVPFFLERLAPQILTTGKYLNVIRECGRWVRNECEEHVVFSDESHAYDGAVARAHDFASRSLLTLLLEEEQLLARLRSIKHYFLLDQGDFFVHFMDLAYEELGMPAKNISISRLQSLLDMCLRARNINDSYQEDLECELSHLSIIEHVTMIHDKGTEKGLGSSVRIPAGFPLSNPHSAAAKDNMLEGISAFTLNINVKWPLSLVLSKFALTKYQLIFRHLFYCKHVETRICASWLQQQSTKELNLRSLLGPQYALLQRMLHFLQNFEYYVMFEVLEPRWHDLENRLHTVKTVDELMKHHGEFLDTCLRECLLTDQGLLKIFAKLMAICLNFAESQENFARNVDEASAAIETNALLAIEETKTKDKSSKEKKTEP